jgi:hypothetical protein
MSAVMSEAENKFFSSGGSDVAPELKPKDAPPETAAPATTSTPASTPATTPAAPVTESTQQQVPLAALHEERQKRARAEQERQALQERVRQFEDAIAQAQKQQQQPAAPDPNVDPIGAALHQAQVTKAELEEVKQWRAQQEQASQHQNLRQQFTQAVANSEAAFRASHPDYDQAFNHASQQYDKMLKAMIPDPVARRQRVIQEANGVALQLLSEGRDPAQFFYDFAREMGYTGTPPAPTTVTQQAAPVQQTTSEVVKTIERGLKQQGNSGGGGATPGEITPEMALNLPAAEYNKWWTKQFKR